MELFITIAWLIFGAIVFLLVFTIGLAAGEQCERKIEEAAEKQRRAIYGDE